MYSSRSFLNYKTIDFIMTLHKLKIAKLSLLSYAARISNLDEYVERVVK